MRFAAGLTATGIIGFIIVEALKLLMPALTAWAIGILAAALKLALIGVGLLLAVGAVALAIFLFVRSQRAKTED